MGTLLDVHSLAPLKYFISGELGKRQFVHWFALYEQRQYVHWFALYEYIKFLY